MNRIAREKQTGIDRDPGSVAILVVPHTHWDREWYDTFEGFRFRLVEFMDRLIEVLEKDDSIPSFLLDGQMILIDDYLEVKPAMEERLRKLAGRGRITLGPWWVQPDEFLVSGESLVRNLQIGIRRARTFGKPMLHGYVPDTFGHIMQLPQILRGFGIETFFTMRGLGDDLARIGTEFYWKAPDGSKVLTHYLAESYSNGGRIGPTPQTSYVHHGEIVSYDNLHELIDRMSKRTRSALVLVMNGSDHTALQEDLADAVRSLSTKMSVRLGSLDEYVRGIETAGLSFQTVRGELRYGRYHPVLRGVLSTRIYLKQLNNRATEHLEVEAERFSSFAAATGYSPRESFLDYAWKRLIENHAHDSICGCSIDSVHDEVMIRLRKSLEVSEAASDDAIEHLAILAVAGKRGPDTSAGETAVIPIVVFNPSPWERSGTVEAQVHPIEDSPLGVRQFGFSVAERDFSLDECILEDEEGNNVAFEKTSSKVAVADALYRRKTLLADSMTFFAKGIPPLGYRIYQLRRDGTPNAGSKSGKSSGDDRPAVLDNGIVRLTMENDGTLTLLDHTNGTRFEGLNSFVDEGDVGDEYGFSAPGRQKIYDSHRLQWTIARRGSCLSASAWFELPESASSDLAGRSAVTARCRIETHAWIEPSSPIVRIRTTFDNRSQDHRLRALFPTGLHTKESVAETAFGLIRRPVAPNASAGWREPDTATYPQRRFVSIESHNHVFTLFNRGLPEFEVTADGDVLLTLVRSVGWLSRYFLFARDGQTMSGVPTPGAQCTGVQVFDYAIAAFDTSLPSPSLFRMAEEYLHPLVGRAVQTAKTAGGKLDFDSFLWIDNEQVVLSALRPVGKDGCVLRVFNPYEESQQFVARWGIELARVEQTSLDEKTGEELDLPEADRFSATVPAFAISTFRVYFKVRD